MKNHGAKSVIFDDRSIIDRYTFNINVDNKYTPI